jgi:hypothetical protein
LTYLILIGFISQQINPNRATKRYIKRIDAEKTIICSSGTKNGEKSKIKVASRVPIPEIEIGSRTISPTMVIEIAK